MEKHLAFECTPDSFVIHPTPAVRWLDWDADYAIACSMWPPEWPLTREIWIEARELGYEYAGAFVGDNIVASAAVWRYSDRAWETAAVRTRSAYQRQGYATQLVAFITKYILEQGRIATCHTAEDNLAMQQTAFKVGFYIVEEQKG